MADQTVDKHDAPRNVVKRWYATSNQALLSEDVKWRVLDSFPAGGLYNGRLEVTDRFFPQVQSRFRSYRAEPKEFFVDGDTVITIGEYIVESLSGHKAKVSFAHVWTIENEMIVSFRQVSDTAAINALLA